MRERLFCDNWQFLKTGLDSGIDDIQRREEEFAPVCLPHDWLIYDTRKLYEDSAGWYRRRLTQEELAENLGFQEGERVFLRFDGVYMDSTLYINRKKAMEWKYGYSAFGMDITDLLKEGVNELLVRAAHRAPNSRWYSGAGIYRNVFIRVMPVPHLPYDGIYVSTKPCGEDFLLEIETEIAGKEAACEDKLTLSYTLCDGKGGAEELGIQDGFREKEGRMVAIKQTVIKKPVLWDVDAPHLYKLKVGLFNKENVLLDEDTVTVGFRTMEFCPETGFYLNGRRLKVHGVCEHHDFGCLGAAFHEEALRRKFRILKAMGVNGVRTSHNMPAKEFMDIADEMGMLIVSEAFDMWERKKTDYDYARFFKEWAEKDVESWVRRDRNHPSLMLWSIGNEIYDTHADTRGQEITKRLVSYVKRHDPKENARITIGSNYMPWENAQKCADIVKIAGYNYGEKYYGAHHKEHPDWVIYGSETASVVQSRGVYHFPYSQSVLADEDEQCSALGNSTTSWGAKSIEKCIADDRDAGFTFGQFLWTGFDYIGEPTPYHTKNSYFGQIDTAGFAKDAYYIYQAEWTDAKKAPMVHLFPYWDFNPGQMIDVRACTNGAAVELFVNGISHGKKRLNHREGLSFTAAWQVPYAEGEIKAVAYDEEGGILAEKSRHSFKDGARILAVPEKMRLKADGRDLCFVEISVEDEDGHPVENAMNYVKIEVEGPAFLVGLDNGDSTDYDSYKGKVRKLFCGKLLAVLKAGTVSGTARIRVSGKGLLPAEFSVAVSKVKAPAGIGDPSVEGCKAGERTIEREKEEELLKQQPVRKILLTSTKGQALTEKTPQTIVEASVYPPDATDGELIFKAVNDAGIEIGHAKIEAFPKEPALGEKKKIKVTALGDGAFRIRCMSKSGTDSVKLLSSLEFSANGLGAAYLNPYGFVTGGLYTEAIGEIGNGNEKGFATARGEESGVIFTGIDFGETGSDEITLPLFTLSDASYRFRIWEGRPGEKEDGLLLDAVYQKTSVWNTYQEETYRLARRVKGVTSLSFLFYDKVHMKGFSFKKYEKAFEKLSAAACDRIYGDSFRVETGAVTGIGNNVTLEFDDMDFGEDGTEKICICGRSGLAENTIHIRFTMEDGGELSRIAEFAGAPDYEEQSFLLNRICGKCRVSFVFLPGSSFDFAYFAFSRHRSAEMLHKTEAEKPEKMKRIDTANVKKQ